MERPQRQERVEYAFNHWRGLRSAVELAREDVLREMRAAVAEGVSQSELARLVGVSRQAIHELLK